VCDAGPRALVQRAGTPCYPSTSLRLDRVLDVVPVDDGIRRRAAGRGQGRRVGDRPRGRLVGVVGRRDDDALGVVPGRQVVERDVRSHRAAVAVRDSPVAGVHRYGTARVTGSDHERQRAGRLPRRDLVQVDVT
jgi:hypothetical protein